MSLDALAELLDTLASEQGVLITETPTCLVASKLDVCGARKLAMALEQLKWAYQLVDKASNAFTLARLDIDFAPFRLTLHKVLPTDDGALYLLSATGFCDALERAYPADYWRLARLKRSFVTQGRAYGNWSEPLCFNKAAMPHPPRELVRETATHRRVPEDIRFWLLNQHSPVDLTDPLHSIWASKAFDALTRALANGMDASGGALVFHGPPALRLPLVDLSPAQLHQIGSVGFDQLQAAARWVYELSREAALRHAMLSAEIARAGREACEPASYFATHVANALDSAKTVYQLHVSGLGIDTLNSLTALRGNVCDDAARTTEATQQALTKVAAALGVGLTVIATRVGSDVGPWLTFGAMLVACVYCFTELWAGWQLIRIRRNARDAWHPRLYRFLPSADYSEMVKKPAQRSECIYLWATGIGFMLVVVLSIVVVVNGFLHVSTVPLAPGSDSDKKVQEPTQQGAEYPAAIWMAKVIQPAP